jgi:hypothetical protein
MWLSGLICFLLFCIQLPLYTRAFTQGNLLVLKVGAQDGSSAVEGDPSSENYLTISYLEEIDISTNSVIPSTRIDLSLYDLLLPSWNGQSSIGSIASGGLELSADGMYVTFGAYQGGKVNDFMDSAPLRVAVRVDSKGSVVVLASITKAAYSKGAIKSVRSVCSVNGKQAWFTGFPNTVCYVDSLLPSEPTCISNDDINSFGCSIFNKQLHLTGRERVSKLGIGLPRETNIASASSTSFAMDSTTPGNLFASAWFEDDNNMWTCDSTGDASTSSGLYKWTKTSGTWTRTSSTPKMPLSLSKSPPCSDVVGVNGNIYFTVFTKNTVGAAVWKYDPLTLLTTEILNANSLINPLTHMYRGIAPVPNSIRTLQKGNLLVFRMGPIDGSGPDLKSPSVAAGSINSAWVDEISPIDGTIFTSIDLDYDVSGFASGFKACGQEGYVSEEGPNAGTLSFTQDGHVLVQYQCGTKGSSPLRIVAAIHPSPLNASAVYVGLTGEPFKNDLFTGACARTLAEGVYMTGWGKSAGCGLYIAKNNQLSCATTSFGAAAGCTFSITGTGVNMATKMIAAGPHLGSFYEYPGIPLIASTFSIMERQIELKRYATDFLTLENGGKTYLWVADCYFMRGSVTLYGLPGINRYVKGPTGSYTFEKNYLGFAATGISSAVDASGTTIIYATALDYPSYTTSGPSYIVAINTMTDAINVIRSSGTSSIQYRGIAIVPDALGTFGAKTIPEVTPTNPIPMWTPLPSASPSPSVFAPISVAVSGMTDGQKGGIAAGVIIGLLLLGCIFQFFCRRGAAMAMSKMDDLSSSRESGGGMKMFQLPMWKRSQSEPTTGKAPALPVRRGSRRGSEVEEGDARKKKRRASSVVDD